MADTGSGQPQAFSDGDRAVRGLLVGAAGTLLLLGRLPINEANSLGFLSAMLVERVHMTQAASRMTAAATRQFSPPGGRIAG